MCWTTGIHRAQLWRSATYGALHQTVRQVVDAGGVLVATSQPLTTSASAFGAAMIDDDISFGSIAPGLVITAMTIAQTSGPSGGAELSTDQQRLVCWVNRVRIKGVPNLAFAITPNGQPIKLDAGRIFQA